MWEYKVLINSATDIQKTLNQWRHQFDLEILQMCIDKDEWLVVLLKRRPKEFNDETI